MMPIQTSRSIETVSLNLSLFTIPMAPRILARVLSFPSDRSNPAGGKILSRCDGCLHDLVLVEVYNNSVLGMGGPEVADGYHSIRVRTLFTRRSQIISFALIPMDAWMRPPH